MKVEVALERLGGVATHAELRRLVSRGRIRVAVTRGRILRDGRGHYALPGADHALRVANQLSAVLTLDSAAQHYGWKLKHKPREVSLTVPRKRKVRARPESVRIVYADLQPHEVRGKATAPLRTVLDCASRMPFDEALAIADSALRNDDVTKAELVAAAEQMPGRYRARCLRVARAADHRAANPFESVLRAIALDIPGLRVEPQVWLDNVGSPDLVDRRLRLVIEADSFAYHAKRHQLIADCERYNAFAMRGWIVIRFGWEHVMLEPAYVARVLRAMMQLLDGRPSGPALDASQERLSA